MRGLSDRAKVLLVLISERTETKDGTFSDSDLVRYWVPRAEPDYLSSVRLHPRHRDQADSDMAVCVHGFSDAAAIRALARRGLVRMQPVADYACSCTEDGRIEAERILASGEIGERS